jgi:hypothetical protein
MRSSWSSTMAPRILSTLPGPARSPRLGCIRPEGLQVCIRVVEWEGGGGRVACGRRERAVAEGRKRTGRAGAGAETGCASRRRRLPSRRGGLTASRSEYGPATRSTGRLGSPSEYGPAKDALPARDAAVAASCASGCESLDPLPRDGQALRAAVTERRRAVLRWRVGCG